MKIALGLFTTVFIIAAAMLLKFPAGVRFHGYGVIRELMKAHAVMGTWGMDKITSEHFGVRFEPEKRAEAELVLEAAEQFYRPVSTDFGYSARGKIPVILYSSKEELNKSFGWEAKESAMGVYWAGTIRVLSPGVWAGDVDKEQVKDKFISSGPMAHELTHLMVDYLTGGNYPRWFTEGVAQYEDYKLTGFAIGDPVVSTKRRLYSMEELAASFDSLPDQTMAYEESFAAVYYIVRYYGEDALYELISQLGRGYGLNQAMENVLSLDIRQFEKEWMNHKNCNRDYTL